jgi:hypothetical protein
VVGLCPATVRMQDDWPSLPAKVIIEFSFAFGLLYFRPRRDCRFRCRAWDLPAPRRGGLFARRFFEIDRVVHVLDALTGLPCLLVNCHTNSTDSLMLTFTVVWGLAPRAAWPGKPHNHNHYSSCQRRTYRATRLRHAMRMTRLAIIVSKLN